MPTLIFSNLLLLLALRSLFSVFSLFFYFSLFLCSLFYVLRITSFFVSASIQCLIQFFSPSSLYIFFLLIGMLFFFFFFFGFLIYVPVVIWLKSSSACVASISFRLVESVFEGTTQIELTGVNSDQICLKWKRAVTHSGVKQSFHLLCHSPSLSSPFHSVCDPP